MMIINTVSKPRKSALKKLSYTDTGLARIPSATARIKAVTAELRRLEGKLQTPLGHDERHRDGITENKQQIIAATTLCWVRNR
jgi:hypothetical protein